MQDKIPNNFLNNSLFIKWVLHPDEESDKYWQDYISKNPGQLGEIYQAREIIYSVYRDRHEISPGEADLMLGQLMEFIQDEVPEATGGGSVFTRVTIYALSALLVTCLAGVLLLNRSARAELVSHQTGNGQIKEVILPDGSHVILNANSRIEYDAGWSEKNRKLKLYGEGLFRVSKTREHDKFSVYLNENLVVQVLGTEFIASNRNKGSRVVLNEGKVKMFLEERRNYGLSTVRTHESELLPGDIIVVTQDNMEFARSRVENAGELMAFTNKKISFDNSPLWKVDQVLGDTYGYKLEFSDSVLKNKRFSGSAPMDSVFVLVKAIERLYPVKVVRKK